MREEPKKLAEQYEPIQGLRDRFPVGLKVKDRSALVGVVVGYREGKVLVQETGVPSTEPPPPVALLPELIAPVHPRPSRYELLVAVEEAILSAAKLGNGASVLALAQARELL